MKILILSQFFDPEPGVGRGLPFAKWLVERGHQVEVLTGFPNYPSGTVYPGYKISWGMREVMDGIPVYRIPLYPNHDGSAVKRAANYFSFAASAALTGIWRIRKADLVYVVNLPTVGCAAVLNKWLRGMPFIFNIPDMWPESVLESGMLRSAMLYRIAEHSLNAVNRLVYAQASAVTVISPGFKQMLVAQGVPEKKVHVVYNWVDEELFRPVMRDERLAAELGMAGKFNFVYAGNFGAFQGLETVIRAAVRIKHRTEIQVVLIGTGQCERELRALANQLQASNVRFIPRQGLEKMQALNSLADVLLVHLRDLGFFSATVPSKTQVSLCSGKPVLMAVRGDAADIVERACCGKVCEPEDDMQMAEAMLAMANLSPAELAAMGRNGRQFYLEQMSVGVGAARLLEVFEGITGSSNGVPVRSGLSAEAGNG